MPDTNPSDVDTGAASDPSPVDASDAARDETPHEDPALDESVGHPPGSDESVVEDVRFSQLDPGAAARPETKIDRLLDVRLTLSVELGRRDMLLQEVLHLGQGSILDLEKSASDLVDILINGKLLARGEVVVIDESFGVRITSLVDPIERAKRIGAA